MIRSHQRGTMRAAVTRLTVLALSARLSTAWLAPLPSAAAATHNALCRPWSAPLSAAGCRSNSGDDRRMLFALHATEDGGEGGDAERGQEEQGGEAAGEQKAVPSLEELQRGKPTPGKDLEGLIRDRRVGRLSGTDVDSFVVDESAQRLSDLPELSEYLEARQGYIEEELGGDDDEYYKVRRPSRTGEGGVSQLLLRELRKKATEPAKSSDWFEYGLGSIVRNSVYFLGFLAVLWELYLNSPFFERALPPAPIVF